VARLEECSCRALATLHGGVIKPTESKMKKLLIAVTLAALTSVSQAAELPECNDVKTQKVFTNVVDTWQVLEFKNVNGDDPNKRWCSVYYVGRFGMRSPFMEAIFTLEWINESHGRFWLQVKQSGESCRGVMGNPWSNERCKYSNM
jgi:hypothetical protein